MSAGIVGEEVDAGDQGVGGYHQFPVGRDAEHGGVVGQTERTGKSRRQRLQVAVDPAEFAGAVSARRLEHATGPEMPDLQRGWHGPACRARR